jgi:hypothetical protein
MPVVFVAFAVYVTVPAPWQRVELAPKVNIGVPTVGVIVTVWVEVCGPLHPAALAVMVDVPVHPAAYVTAPVNVFMELPGKAAVVASKLYVIPVVLVAVDV